MKWKVSCIQMDVAFGSLEPNYVKAEALLRASTHDKAEEKLPSVLVLPELWTTGYALSSLPALADAEGKRTLPFLSSLAESLGTGIVGGSYARRTKEGIRNTMPFLDEEGRLLGEYDKLHLFGPMQEPLHLRAGDQLGVVRLHDVLVAGVICYDIRFPEWIRMQALAHARVVFVAAEWPESRLSHWRTLLMARAIENQVFVIACNRVGSDPDHRFAGHSMIIDPWGQVLAEGGMEEEIVSAILDFDEVDAARARIPSLQDRRPQLYRL